MGAPDNTDLGQASSTPRASFGVNDEVYYRQVTRLRELHEFLYQEAVPAAAERAVSIGDILPFYLDPNGRPPTPEEWIKVETRTQALFALLTPALRRKFLMGGTPWIVAW